MKKLLIILVISFILVGCISQPSLITSTIRHPDPIDYSIKTSTPVYHKVNRNSVGLIMTMDGNIGVGVRLGNSPVGINVMNMTGGTSIGNLGIMP